MEQKLGEKSSIESRIGALKKLAEVIKVAKNNKQDADMLLHWLDAMGLVNNFLHEDSHPQILRNMPQIVRFLYENKRIDLNWLSIYLEIALKANE